MSLFSASWGAPGDSWGRLGASGASNIAPKLLPERLRGRSPHGARDFDEKRAPASTRARFSRIPGVPKWLQNHPKIAPGRPKRHKETPSADKERPKATKSAPRAPQERPKSDFFEISRILGPRLACQTCVSIGTESAGICWASFCFCCRRVARQLRARWNARSDERNAQLCQRQAQTRKNGKRSRLRTNCKKNKGHE